MPDAFARIVAWGLIVIHVGLGVWAFVGFAELVLPHVAWNRLSNPLFSRPLLLVQWSLITVAATVFILGYAWRWRHTPVAMSVIYGAMALVCAYQTLFILTHPTRFRAMAIEYAEYALILAFLFLSDHMRNRFT